VALVNNAQRAHLEGMGTVQDVALAKGEIFAGLSASGVAVFNADDPQADIWRELSRDCRQVGFGLDRPADVHGRFVARGLGGTLQLETPWGALELALGVPGVHNARNACAAAAGDAGCGRLAGGRETGAGSLCRGSRGACSVARGAMARW
jgi:UDP-N-acetylmuramoyl-tripeptide--D-alanyl-D-alanine ligase